MTGSEKKGANIETGNAAPVILEKPPTVNITNAPEKPTALPTPSTPEKPSKLPTPGVEPPIEGHKSINVGKQNFYIYGITILGLIFLSIGLGYFGCISLFVYNNLGNIDDYYQALQILSIPSFTFTSTGVALLYSLRYVIFPGLETRDDILGNPTDLITSIVRR